MDPEGFQIRDGDLELTIALVPVQRLVIHEEIIEEAVAKLMLQIRNWGVIRNPVIVDAQHDILLDGNHRAAAFRRLNYAYIPTCIIPYQHPRIRLRQWYRLFQPRSGTSTTPSSLETILAGLALDTEPAASIPQIQESLRSRATGDLHATQQLVGGIATSSGQYQVVRARDPGDIIEIYDQIQRVELAADAAGYSVTYVPDDKAKRHLQGAGTVPRSLFLTPPITKDEVVTLCPRGRVFARKSTRHVIPARPLNVNVPTEWLKRPVPDVNELNRRLATYLAHRRVRELPPGQVFDGRVYAEKLFIFSD